MGAALTNLLSRADAALKGEIESIRATVTGALEKATTDLAAANQNLANVAKEKEKLTTDLATAQGAATASENAAKEANGKLVAFLTGLKQAPKEGATLLQNVEAATKSVSAALASQGVKAEDLPAAEAESGGAGKKSLSEQADAIKDPVEKSKFIQKNMAALQDEMRQRVKAAAK